MGVEVRGTIQGLSVTLKGELLVTLCLSKAHADELLKLNSDELDIEIQKHRERRSQSANGYAWVLIGKIAEKMHPPLSKEEVYREMLKRYGQGAAISVLTEKLTGVKRELDYCEEIGTGTVNGKEFTHLRMWVGSSKYDSREMWVFIQGIVEEAKDLGIETLTPEEIARMEGINGKV